MRKRIFEGLLLFLYDILSLICAIFFALALIEPTDFKEYFNLYWIFGGIGVASTILMYLVFRLYTSIWKYASVNEFLKICLANGITFLGNLVIYFIFTRRYGVLFRWPFAFFFFAFLFGFASRFVLRFLRYFINKYSKFHKNGKRVMVVGAGDAGQQLIHEMMVSDKLSMRAVCVIDDDKLKIGQRINGIKVVGGREDIVSACEKYEIDMIVVAMPSASKFERSEILNICKETKKEIKMLPGTVAELGDKVLINQMRNVDVNDLLGREQIKVNLDEILGYVKDKVILVTGGGGSIGSELCRQIASHYPKQLIIFDIYENNAYDIEQELKRKMPDLNLLALIGSVRDVGRLEDVFREYKPDVVFHAAAHKHVPLMEVSPHEAVKNNVFGTLNTARMADKYGTSRFVLISTDKAVNPTNIMGATKRLCEMVIQTINKKSKCEYVAVRFGNVLGSNGSVIPLFKKQIEAGGPVTVTHKEITRFFMTIPEAVSLVLQAGAYAKGGEIFVLDMGKPVKIYDLAYNLIELSGFTPNKDIMIEVTGLRPGEKLYEEMLMGEEGLEKTPNNLIFIGKPIEMDEETFFNDLDKLYEKAYDENSDMKEELLKLVPTYHPSK